MIFALACFLQWGLYPLYWKRMLHFSSLETLGHRVVFGSVLLFLYFFITKRKIPFKNLSPWVLVSSLLVFANWFTFLYAINNNHIVEGSLGYYLSPLLSVFLGVFYLKERLSLLKKTGLALALIGVIFLCQTKVGAPLITLTLAFSFGFYGLARKKIPQKGIDALLVEITFAAVIMVGYLIYKMPHQEIVGFNGEFSNLLFSIGAGLFTLTPLLCYGKGIKTLDLSTMGVLQYLAPTLQLCLGVFLYNESIDFYKKIALAFIIPAILLFILDYFRVRKGEKNEARLS